MRVGVHQSQHGDTQRIPQLPHHQPAVHIRDAFTLERHHMSVFALISKNVFVAVFLYFEEHDSDGGRPHCNHDAGKQLCAEVIIQQPLERCILLHDQDKFSGGGNVCALIKERQVNVNNDNRLTDLEIKIREERRGIFLIPPMFDETATAWNDNEVPWTKIFETTQFF